jgi:hypothetical protein
MPRKYRQTTAYVGLGQCEFGVPPYMLDSLRYLRCREFAVKAWARDEQLGIERGGRGEGNGIGERTSEARRVVDGSVASALEELLGEDGAGNDDAAPAGLGAAVVRPLRPHFGHIAARLDETQPSAGR